MLKSITKPYEHKEEYLIRRIYSRDLIPVVLKLDTETDDLLYKYDAVESQYIKDNMMKR